jgi:hypothetical protein
MAADANSDVLAMNRPTMLADNFMGLSVFRLVTARRHSIKALPNGGPSDRRCNTSAVFAAAVGI